MGHYALSTVLFLVIPLSILFTANNADPLHILCSDDRINYTLNGAFESNLKNLLETLSSNISTGFLNTSVGGVLDDGVYGQALCRGDINSTACQNCLKHASKQILEECKRKEAIIWYELCQVHYSFQNFFSSMVYAGQYPESNLNEANISNPVHFNEVLMFLMKNLSSEAAYNPTKSMFATGEVTYSRTETIYGLVQCTRDISPDDCAQCLRNSWGDLNGCCRFRQGGIIVSGNCNVRFELNLFYNASSFLLTYPASKGDNWQIRVVVVVTCTAIVILAIIIWSSVVYHRRKKGNQRDEENSQNALLHDTMSPTGVATAAIAQDSDFVGSQELPFTDMATIRAATDNFSSSNKLGQGGFGIVYKGVLPNGKEVAVKRLSRKSWQGREEFKNEIVLIAKLQHRNLVRLLGCGIEGEEKLLIYEFMPNRSLDFFIFDSQRRFQLDWKTWYNIINGIARGLLYLHEDSRLKIIHRDLKPNNVLLDHEMVAKISDFGMARIFDENQNTANTRRIVGTYGYMAPEYAMEGLFSMKSDVFSFGVILLEIISGKRNSGFYLTEHAQTLLTYAWRLWNEGKELEFVDPLLMGSSSTPEVLRCVHIGLLCVQEDPADRPTMSAVAVLLGSESMYLPEPRQPAFSVGRVVPSDQSHLTKDACTNQITVSSISPR